MVEIRNLKFQPLTLHLAESKRTLHLPPRGKTEIRSTDVSEEIKKAQQKGFVALKEQAPPKPAKTSQSETTAPSASKGSTEAKDKKERK